MLTIGLLQSASMSSRCPPSVSPEDEMEKKSFLDYCIKQLTLSDC